MAVIVLPSLLHCLSFFREKKGMAISGVFVGCERGVDVGQARLALC